MLSRKILMIPILLLSSLLLSNQAVDTNKASESKQVVEYNNLCESETLDLIRADYFEQFGPLYYGDGITLDDVTIHRYYGNYNETYVVQFDVVGSGVGWFVLTEYNIGGVSLVFPTAKPVYAWNHGFFSSLEEAYENNKLKEDDLRSIAAILNSNQDDSQQEFFEKVVDQYYQTIAIVENPELSREDVDVKKYYGEFSETHLFRFVTVNDGGGWMTFYEVEIDEFYILFKNAYIPYIWDGTDFYLIDEAYNKGLLSKQDLSSISEIALIERNEH